MTIGKNSNVVELPVFKEETPEVLFAWLKENYIEDIKIYRRYLITLLIPFLIAAGGSIYLAVTKDWGLIKYVQQFLHGYITFAIMYLILRFKMKPKKPTFKDAINWREERKDNYKWLNKYKRDGKI